MFQSLYLYSVSLYSALCLSYSALCCETKWINLSVVILDFGVHLCSGSELTKHLSKCLLQMRKTENWTQSKYFYDGRKFRRQCVNVIDTMWGRIYFLMCETDENFGLGVQRPSVFNDLYFLQWNIKKKDFFIECWSTVLVPIDFYCTDKKWKSIGTEIYFLWQNFHFWMDSPKLC